MAIPTAFLYLCTLLSTGKKINLFLCNLNIYSKWRNFSYLDWLVCIPLETTFSQTLKIRGETTLTTCWFKTRIGKCSLSWFTFQEKIFCFWRLFILVWLQSWQVQIWTPLKISWNNFGMMGDKKCRFDFEYVKKLQKYT